MASLSDYPYDPNADVTKLRDLEKLRAIQDPSMRQMLWDLWESACKYDADPRNGGRELAKRKAAEAEELEWLNALTESALAGRFGRQAAQLACTIVGEHGESRSPGAMRELSKQIRTVDWRRESRER